MGTEIDTQPLFPIHWWQLLRKPVGITSSSNSWFIHGGAWVHLKSNTDFYVCAKGDGTGRSFAAVVRSSDVTGGFVVDSLVHKCRWHNLGYFPSVHHNNGKKCPIFRVSRAIGNFTDKVFKGQLWFIPSLFIDKLSRLKVWGSFNSWLMQLWHLSKICHCQNTYVSNYMSREWSNVSVKISVFIA